MPSRCPDLPLRCVALYKNNLALHQRAPAGRESQQGAIQLEKPLSYHLRVPADCSQLVLSTLNCVAKNLDITIKHGGSLAWNAAKGKTLQEKRTQLLKSKSDGIQLNGGLGTFLKSVLGAEVEVRYAAGLQLLGSDPRPSQQTAGDSIFYDKSAAALGRAKGTDDGETATNTVRGRIIMVEDDDVSMLGMATTCKTYSMLYLARLNGTEVDSSVGSSLEVLKIAMFAIQSIVFRDPHLQDVLKLKMSLACQAYEVNDEELVASDTQDTREAIELALSPTKGSESSEVASSLEISFIDRCSSSWLCNYRLSLSPAAAASKQGETVELSMFGVVNNSTEEDWDDVFLKLITKELNVLNAQSGVAATKGDIFVKTLSGKTLTVPVASFDLYVHQVKQKIEAMTRIPSADQSLIFAGKQLQNYKQLKDYNIQKEAMLYLLLRLRSGGVECKKLQDKMATQVTGIEKSGETEAHDFEQVDAVSHACQYGRDNSVVYNMTHSVSIGSGQTATVSIGVFQTKGVSVLVYDFAMNQLNPLKAVKLTNDLEGNLVLAPGRVSVFGEDGSFCGQSQFVPMLPGEEQLIFYGEDTSCSVSRGVEQDSEELVEVLVKPSSGITLVKNKTKVFSYAVTNHSNQNIASFYIDHETADHSYAILPHEKTVKQSAGWARYELALGPREEVSIKVKEEASCKCDRTRREELQDLLRDPDMFGGALFKNFMQKNVEIEATMKELVLRDNKIKILRVLCDPEILTVRTLKNAVGEEEDGSLDTTIVEKSKAPMLDQAHIPKSIFDSAFKILKWHHERDNVMLRKRRLLETEIIKLDQDQCRIRDNIKTMKDMNNDSSNKLLERYMTDMDRMEDTLHQKREEIVKLEENILSQQREIEEDIYETVVSEAKQILTSMGEASKIPQHRAHPNFELAKFKLPKSLIEEAPQPAGGGGGYAREEKKVVEEEEEEDMDFDLFG